MKSGVLTIATFALLCALAAAPAAAAPGKQRPPQPPPLPEQPNIVVFTTDDQEMMWKEGERVWLRRKIMPQTHRIFSRGGTVFNDFVISTPVCCPSRAIFLTGQYGHNSGVLANNPGYAGLVAPDNVLPVWMRHGGYRTAMIGKWLHGYREATGDFAKPAPGWARWLALLTFNRYYGYELSVDGRRFSYGNGNQDYATKVLTKRSRGFIRDYARFRKPLFMWISHMAPHSAQARPNPCNRSALPERKDFRLYRNELLPLPPNFNEVDVSGKPSFMQERSLLDEGQVADLGRRHRCRLRALRSVDRSIREVVNELRDAGQLRNTVFMFWSDNGYFQGEHRLRSGKGLPYEEAIHVPLAIRVPPGYRNAPRPQPTVALPTASIDLAPTILDLAGLDPCHRDGRCRALDGRSLMPLIDGRFQRWPEQRTMLIEQQNEAPGVDRRRDWGPCTYRAIRTPAEVYIEHYSIMDASLNPPQCVAETPPIREHYDRALDPYQLQNLYDPQAGPTEHQQQLASQLDGLKDCAGNGPNPVAGRTPCW